MGEAGMIEVIPNLPYPPHLELILHMPRGMPSMAICLLRARHRRSRRNTKVSCNKQDKDLVHQGMTSLLAPRIRRLMQELHPIMPTCSMHINSGWPVRLGSPSLEIVLATATTPLATGQVEVHQAPQGDPSMVLLCREPTMQQWDTAMTMAETGGRLRTPRPGGALEIVEGREAPEEPSVTRSVPHAKTNHQLNSQTDATSVTP